MNILALDLATRTGWAYDVKGVRESGVAEFPVRPYEVRGWKFIRFSHWLYTWQRDWRFDLIVCEKPIANQKSWAATDIAYGFSTRVEEMCARNNIRFEQVPSNTLKKFATGSGRSEKAAMLNAAQALKRGVTDHNEADALWLLRYAESKFAKRDEAA